MPYPFGAGRPDAADKTRAFGKAGGVPPQTSGLPLALGTGGGLPPLPPGFIFLVDRDGAYLTDADGAFLVEPV